MHQGQRLWLLAGTGEGPPLAAQMLQRGWRVRVSVVTAAAAAAYRSLEAASTGPALELAVGALAGPAAITAALEQARHQGDPFAALIDATHPFARQISQDLALVCADSGVPLLRLGRVLQQPGDATVLSDLAGLQGCALAGRSVLLALGARQLAAAVNCSPGARHHARVLPAPAALRQALAAGLDPARLAALRPSRDFAIETALVRRWGIHAIVCRQSGGAIEAGWRLVSQRCGCQLVLLARPAEPHAVVPLSEAALLATLEALLAKG
jgi:precorrin-6A/cobalt-precorrin-6A reductase